MTYFHGRDYKVFVYCFKDHFTISTTHQHRNLNKESQLGSFQKEKKRKEIQLGHLRLLHKCTVCISTTLPCIHE
jgi:hypothetical protein